MKKQPFWEKTYWDNRYKNKVESGKGSGSGEDSYGIYAEFKAKIINDFIKEYDIYTSSKIY